MAVTVTEINAGDGARGNVRIWDITKSADGDTTSGNIAHGFGATPEEVSIVPMAGAPHIALPRFTTVDGTNLVVGFQTTAGAGSASVCCRVIAKRPTALTR